MTPWRAVRRTLRRRVSIGTVLVAIGLALGGAHIVSQPRDPDLAASDTIARVVDGDTVVLATGTTVRLAGIDTPEARSYGRVTAECVHPQLAAQATAHLEALAGPGTPVTVHQVDTDRYGRVVARITAAGVDVGQAQLDAGLAVRWPDQTGTCPTGGER